MTSAAETLTQLTQRFRPQAAQDLTAVYQLHLTGDDGGLWHLTIADQKCTLADGPAPNFDVAITMTTDDWLWLLAGRLDALSAYLAGRITIIGDFSLITRLQTLFDLQLP
jgi:putative sterol carrier protein